MLETEIGSHHAGHVVVVGAGVGGMAAAIRLAEAGVAVTVFDPAGSAAGLASGFEVGGGSVERFYHHLFRSDVVAQRWIADLGLGDRLEWLPASMGFYAGGGMRDFGTPLSLLRFSPLPFLDRIRLGLRIRRLGATPSADAFENVTAVRWLSSRASATEMRVFWRPLLEAKFGSDADEVSMAWLWARFRARVGGSPWRGERLGYLRGGFQGLGDRMAARATALGADVRLGVRVTRVVVDAGRVAGVETDAGTVAADAVLWTPSLNILARAVPELPPDYRALCASIKYHMAVVAVVETRDSALPYYWVTVGDDDLPFTVAVEHTRLVGTADYSGRTVIYLGRYAAPDDPVVKMSDTEVERHFLEAAQGAFGAGFADPLAVHIFRAPAAQPIVPPGWESRRPDLLTGLPGLVAANMAQIYPWDRGVNYSVELGERAAEAVEAELSRRLTQTPA